MVRFAGSDVTRVAPARRFRMGVARTLPNGPAGSPSVRQHLEGSARGFGGQDGKDGKGTAGPDRAGPPTRRRGARRPGPISSRRPAGRGVAAGHGPAGGIGRALAGAPRVVLLDEPSSGLDTGESETLSAALRRVREGFRVAFVLVEHDVEMVMSLSDQVDVLDFGQSIASGPPSACSWSILGYGAPTWETPSRRGRSLLPVQQQDATQGDTDQRQLDRVVGVGQRRARRRRQRHPHDRPVEERIVGRHRPLTELVDGHGRLRDPVAGEEHGERPVTVGHDARSVGAPLVVRRRLRAIGVALASCAADAAKV